MKSKRLLSSVFSQSLGELELSVLGVLWRSPDLDAKSIITQLGRDKPPTLSTMQSTLERLHKKGMLQRRKQGLAYFYRPLVSRPELLGRMMSQIIRLLHDGRTGTILSSFVNVAAELDRDALDELEQLIAKRRAETAQEKGEGKADKDSALAGEAEDTISS